MDRHADTMCPGYDHWRSNDTGYRSEPEELHGPTEGGRGRKNRLRSRLERISICIGTDGCRVSAAS